jgi:hypothetical protein
MSLSRIALATIAASLLTSAAVADSVPATSPPQPGVMGGHGMMRGMFTKEERMMLFVDSFKATAGMTDDQKHAYRQERRNRIMAMTETDRAKLKADLDARWNALPAEQKASITAKMQAFMAARQARYGQ